MIKFIFKWVLRVVMAAVALVIVAIVVLLLSYNSMLRVAMERQIRAQTGMNAEIGKFSLNLTEPTVTIQNLKLYNPPDFGGTAFLDIPEIHVEYDLDALRKHELHITLLRFNLGEVDVVKNQAGRTNIVSLAAAAPVKSANSKTFAEKTGLHFTDIDVLNVSIGKAQFIDLNNSRNNRIVNIGLQNVIVKNVKSEADLYGLIGVIWLHGGNVVGLPDNPNKPKPVMIFKMK